MASDPMVRVTTTEAPSGSRLSHTTAAIGELVLPADNTRCPPVEPAAGRHEEASPYADAIRQIEGYAALERGWDSYGAAPITEAAREVGCRLVSELAEMARRHSAPLRPPLPGPHRTGGVNLVWEHAGRTLMVNIPPEGEPLTSLWDDGRSPKRATLRAPDDILPQLRLVSGD